MKAALIASLTVCSFIILNATQIIAENAMKEGQMLTSVDDVCRTYPDRMRTLLESLDLDAPGLQDVKRAYQKDALVDACRAFLAYYRNGQSGAWLRGKTITPGEARDAAGDAICNDTLTFYGQTATVPRFDDGRVDWNYTGPAKDMEWAWALNRHLFFDILRNAFMRTGNPKYVIKTDHFLQDWVISSIPYPRKRNDTAMWRGLEVSSRVKSWARVFYGFQDQKAFSDATRLLLLSAVPEHAHYLRHFHRKDANWKVIELSALTMAGAAWPEFKDASGWIEYAKSQLTEEIENKQVYPDGVQTELTASYHLVTLSNFEQFADICRNAAVPLPNAFESRLAAMWNYLAYTLRPDGYGLLNNDSDKTFNRKIIMKAAETYKRDDWRFIASNGQEGVLPNGAPSVIFPWAGQLVMRSGYDADAQWAFFDIGPWGTNHQHNDKLHVSVSAYGRDLLVDSGRFAYAGELADMFGGQTYAAHSAAHNVILIDGAGQTRGPRRAEAPLNESDYKIESAFDYARGAFDGFDNVEGNVTHTRAVMYVRGAFWIVVDRIQTDRPRTLQALWHWHPHCTVAIRDDRVSSTDPNSGNLEIIPAGNISWDVNIVKGQKQPRVQGWYSERYNSVEPSPVAVYSTSIAASMNMAWVLVPARGRVPRIDISILSQNADQMTLRIVDSQQNRFDVVVPLTSTVAPAVKRSSR